ncbi:MAG: hypothetical protein WA484_13355 [Solirubrobacteraceae bacterium]
MRAEPYQPSRRLLGTLGVAALGLGLAACGGSNGGTTSHNASSSSSTGASKIVESNFSTHHNDRDNDGDHNDDDAGILLYGHAAGPADRRISVALVKRYYAAATGEDGAAACPLLVPFIAESVVETDGHSPGLRGKTCAAVMSKLFKLHHRLLAEKNATLKVIGVRVEGNKALVILEFPFIPEAREITERRVGSTWKLLELLDIMLE